MKPIIKIENLSKQYRLGTIGTGTISNDLKRWWYRVRGKDDPFLKIGENNDRSVKASSEYVWAIRDINLQIMPGEVLGIIGKNGAGKSTLLKILSKVTGPTTGSISFNGRIGSLLEVGTGFHPELTGRENIFLNGAILGMTRQEIKSKLDEIVDFSGCERYIDTPVKRYSSGMTVRLGFAVAAHLEPEILVVDEVLAVGDAEFQKKAIGKMQDVSKQDGRTVLFVSHNMAAIEQLCSKTALLDKGRLINCDITNNIITKYLSTNLSSNSELLKTRDRKGAGEIKFSKIELFEENNQVELLRSGKKARFRLHYQASVNKDFKDCRIGIAILKNNSELIVLASELVCKDKIILKNSGYIEFAVPSLPLSKGNYGMTFFLESEGVIQDHLNNAYLLLVEDGKYYEYGKNYPNGWQGKTVLIKHTFSYA